ncbi:MAG: hypothetical protein M0R77_02340 [Gammaproteobacteria bacterium]|nr:hypothetical protein [Gammaproteobacteria bacterium]
MNQKLTKKDVIDIFKSSSTSKDIAKKFDVSITTVNDIKSRKNYKNFTNGIGIPGQPAHTKKRILTPEIIEQIYYFSGTAQEIKNKFGCSIKVARNIKFGNTYQAITATLGVAGEIRIYGLTWEDICDIRSSDETISNLAKYYNVTTETIRNIQSKKTRRYQ